MNPVREHQSSSPTHLQVAVITVSDTRTLETDTSGQLIVERLQAAGFEVSRRELVADDAVKVDAALQSALGQPGVDAVLLTGGTGITSRDGTVEVVTRILDKVLDGYGELFRMLSYQEIGAAAMLSRATGGMVGGKVVLCMPGSKAACRLAMDMLIVPELPHLVREARR